MELSYPEDSKSSSEETDRSSEHINDLHDEGTGRTFECVFCKRGFTTAQALGGHMNIHRKDRANNNNKAKPNFPSSSSSKVIDDNYADLGYYYSSIQSCHLARRGNNYSTIVPDHEVVTNNNYQYHPSYFPPHSCGGTTPSSHVHYNSEVLCVENQRDRGNLFGQDSRQKGLSLYTNPLCVHENNDQIKDNNSEEDGLDLELRLGHHP